MPNPQVAQLISDHLRDGIMHPGDEARGIPSRPIMLPFKPSPGMPQEMADLMTETTKQLGEAIVALLETRYELVPTDQARTLRFAAENGEIESGRVLPVFCRCDDSAPLFTLTIIDPQHVTVDGPTFLRSMHRRKTGHPHRDAP